MLLMGFLTFTGFWFQKVTKDIKDQNVYSRKEDFHTLKILFQFHIVMIHIPWRVLVSHFKTILIYILFPIVEIKKFLCGFFDSIT